MSKSPNSRRTPGPGGPTTTSSHRSMRKLDGEEEGLLDVLMEVFFGDADTPERATERTKRLYEAGIIEGRRLSEARGFAIRVDHPEVADLITLVRRIRGDE